MAYDAKLNLPSGWITESDSYTDETGYDITHIQSQKGGNLVEVYIGDIPEGETAEDQAFANYAETVGFSDDDPEDFNPVFKIKFNGKNAWGFDAICDEDMPMRFLSQEVKKGILAVIVMVAKNDEELEKVHQLVERNFRLY